MLLVLVHWVGTPRTKKDQQELGSFGPEDHHTRLIVLLVLVSLPAGTSITTTNSGDVYGVVVP